MSEEDAFIAVLRADPSDDATRLVYADWLEDRGDVRAELIRLEARMASLAPSCDEYAGLKPRRTALRAGADADWLKAMGYVPRHRPLFTKLPERRVERWRLVEEFIDTWYRPLAPGDGCTEEEITAAERRLGFRLPAALREWHALAGKRGDVWSRQDHFRLLAELRFDDARDALIIQIENQGCEVWGVRSADLGLDNPPVWEMDAGELCSPTLTAFACTAAVYASKFNRLAFLAQGGAGEEDRETASAGFTRCDLPERYWAGNPHLYYERDDVILEFESSGWVLITGRTEEALRPLGASIRGLEIVYRPT